MKRWQIRGEVEDSEDGDELSLEVEWPSPERPRKRAKYGPDGGLSSQIQAQQHVPSASLEQLDSGGVSEHDEPWLQPQVQVARSYGRKARPAKQSPSKAAMNQVFSGRVYNAFSSIAPSVATRETGDSPPKQETETGLLRITDLSYSTPREKTPQSDANSFSSLPGLNTLFAAPDQAQLPLPGSLSSPLSERDVSPQRPSVAPQSPQDDAVDRLGDLSGMIDAATDEVSTSAALVRRNLRSRKPEQLKPYQLERARYLQQCRARGVKPVRLIEQDQTNEHVQADQDSQSQDNFQSSSPIPEERIVRREANRDLDSHSVDIPNSSSSARAASGHHLPKRRETRNASSNRSATSRRTIGRHTDFQHNEFDIPPSPPSTSSRAGTLDVVSPIAPRFKFPMGFTPAPLPTPQVSSEARHEGLEVDSSMDSQPRMLRRRLKASRHQRDHSVISLASGSDQQSDPEDEGHGLRREQKRIRGVLPASWLKIDFKAQRRRQSSTAPRMRRSSSSSPSRLEPQKGVARRVTTTGRSNHDIAVASTLPDDSDDSQESEQPRNPVWKQQRLDFPSGRLLPMAPSETLDEDLMENDFVDPMLAGSSHSYRTKRTRERFGQARITESYQRSFGKEQPFSGERRGWNGKQGRRRSNAPEPKRSRPRPVSLSIADAPSPSPSGTGGQLPQFVRLALRRTRQDRGRGRHSPTHKRIRLATAADTEDACSVLHAWRDGSIRLHDVPNAGSAVTNDDVQMQDELDITAERAPLEISRNKRQQTFREPLRKDHENSEITVRRAQTARVRQTRLQPIVFAKSIPTDTRPVQGTNGGQRTRNSFKQPLRAHKVRDAQVETLETTFHACHRTSAFEHRMQRLTESIARSHGQQSATGYQLERYLRTEPPTAEEVSTPAREHSSNGLELGPSFPRHDAGEPQYRSRKARARRIDVETYQYEQPPGPSVESPVDDPQLNAADEISGPVLQGLGSFGITYTVDFDVRPLDEGIVFDQDSFIGSGDFSDALAVAKRDLDVENGRIQVHLNGEVLEWASWNEEVASQIASVPSAVLEALQTLEEAAPEIDMEEQHLNVDRNIAYLLRSLVRYISKCLHFVDRIDRQPCIATFERLVESLVDIVIEDSEYTRQFKIRILQYALVVAKQAAHISEHPLVDVQLRGRVLERLFRTGKSLSKYALAGRTQELFSVYENSRRSVLQAVRVSDRTYALSSVVILNNLFTSSSFWDVLGLGSERQISNLRAVKDFDSLWRDIFSLLPALEIQPDGKVAFGSRFTTTQQGWGVVKSLLDRLFELYDASSRMRGFTVNDYMRTTFSRCHLLVNSWGWWKCEPILNTMFDFFAHRNLALLRNEQSRGSPKFLEEPGDSSYLEILPDDRSFHIFLKLLASGLLGMRKHCVYSEKKIGGIGYRLIPNHGRSFRKDGVVERQDLEALRNHFDILCTLHCTLPPAHRIRLELLPNLIDHSVSHREACRLSVRAWTKVTSFQVSTHEPIATLDSFVEWFHNMLKATIAQFRLARSEAERARREAELEGILVQKTEFESAVSSNQQQVVKTLTDLIAGLKRVLSSSCNLLSARALIEGSKFWHVFELFDPLNHGLQSTISEALKVTETAIEMENRMRLAPNSQQEASEDSQEFGDYAALQEYAADEGAHDSSSPTLTEALYSPVAQFVSNVFGADRAAEDALQQRLIDVWIELASISVAKHEKSWSSYTDEYSTTSWYQMRETAQKRKYTAYFLARIIKHASADEDVRPQVLKAWILSLVEREVNLKFQHLLTSALLNCCAQEPLLHNLPFVRDSRTTVYQVSLEEVRHRRLALISSILCNMREHVEQVADEQPARRNEVKCTYRGMLSQLMQAMKANYQELQLTAESEVADVNAKGAYVEFVQHVVSFLQQHTLEICRIDQFFTESTVFPLPVGDPTYVVGRLRSYTPKLRDGGTRKKLVAFVHSVSERAATDGQQEYLVDQLSTAVKGVRERGNESAPSLRHVLLAAIFPAYIDSAFSTACGWIMALPVLASASQAILELMYTVELENRDSTLAAIESVSTILASIEKQYWIVQADPGLLSLAHVQRTLAAMLQVAESSLTFASYVERCTEHGKGLSSHMQAQFEVATALSAGLCESDQLEFLAAEPVDDDFACRWPDTKAAADRHVRESLGASWYGSDGRYFVRRGNTTKEIAMSLESDGRERERLLQALKGFQGAYLRVFDARNRMRREDLAGDGILEDVLV
ncbi:uncharacterized protein RCC_03111 [Lecanosticta acicola]|uniref:Uncharacterized protein RCC_03111 n=1 Tax=Lecanosticta acicola TaxID=111012 RepID=A0AAI8Z890_9PEZI|nr:uncharacterized protein RCC_03111 [Lecanosticta acicola]